MCFHHFRDLSFGKAAGKCKYNYVLLTRAKPLPLCHCELIYSWGNDIKLQLCLGFWSPAAAISSWNVWRKKFQTSHLAESFGGQRPK